VTQTNVKDEWGARLFFSTKLQMTVFGDRGMVGVSYVQDTKSGTENVPAFWGAGILILLLLSHLLTIHRHRSQVTFRLYFFVSLLIPSNSQQLSTLFHNDFR
jgi:hypothetical protein